MDLMRELHGQRMDNSMYKNEMSKKIGAVKVFAKTIYKYNMCCKENFISYKRKYQKSILPSLNYRF